MKADRVYSVEYGNALRELADILRMYRLGWYHTEAIEKHLTRLGIKISVKGVKNKFESNT